ncbi:MAG: cytochrome P450 [Acidimicrobiales bacterium]|nr:cytochrome P450 [Acidimicrobiales bacterium]
MSTATSPVYYDPYSAEIAADPQPTYRRLRDEAPLYYNDAHDFFAMSRYADCEAGIKDWATFSSKRGNIVELIKAGFEMPSGVLIYEDPPVHTIHRGLLSRVFTPKKMLALEDKVRAFCADCLDPHVGSEGFDFIADLGALVPMRTIGMLLGIPDEDQEALRDRPEAQMRTKDGKPMRMTPKFAAGAAFADYVDWRAKNPSDDIMTMLIEAEFEDEHGVERRLTREEILTYVNVISGAGNETTIHVIGWAGSVLAENPDQRTELHHDPSLIPGAIEELLRYQPPAPHAARYVTRDVELYGQTVPAGSTIVFVTGAANRDDRRFEEPDRFDIHRRGPHLTFGFGIHFCLGAALARLEGRVVLEEVLARFPEWHVDEGKARLAQSSTVSGWETLPVSVR